MSRVGNKPIEIPSGVKVTVSGTTVTVEGPKGTLKRDFPPMISVAWGENEKTLVCSVKGEVTREAKAMWGTSRALIQNMVTGVKTGYEKAMEIVGVGWGASVSGQTLKLSVGYANAIPLTIPQGLSVTVEKQLMKISGADKQAVGHFAAMARSVRKPEPYNGKGVKYAGEVIKKKQGKQFGS